jgi:threonine efflux protein
MEGLHDLLLVYVTYLIATASPGPSNMAIMAVAMSRGRRPALYVAMGVVAGSQFWAVLAATGLSAILSTYADALVVIKVVGGLYLIYLALKSAKAALSPAIPKEPALPAQAVRDRWVLFRRGALMHLTNPKAVLAWIAIMSLGLRADAPTHILFLILGGCLLLGIVVFGGYALAFSTAAMVTAYRRARRWIEGTLAVFFGFAGLRLLLSKS